MDYRKCALLLLLVACILLSVSAAAASDADDAPMASENEVQVMENENGNSNLASPSKEDVISGDDAQPLSAPSDSNAIAKSLESDVLSASGGNDAAGSAAGTASKKTTKSTLLVSAPKVVNVYKKGTFKVKVKDKKTKKPVKGIKLKIKVYTGKKYKTYSVKTNKNGVAKISTKKLSKGTHKVTVTAKATKKYKGKTVKSSIRIKASSTGRLATKIIAEYKLKWASVRTGETGKHGYPIYGLAPDISMHLTLKAANGDEISGKYRAYIYYYDNNGELMRTEWFTDKYGGWVYYTGTHGPVQYKVVVNYEGNSKYGPSQFSAESSRIKIGS